MGQLATGWRSFRAQVTGHRADLGFALRVTVAAIASLVLSRILSVPLPLWTVLTAVVLTQVSFGRSVKATIDYLSGTLCGAVYAGLVAALVPHPNEVALAGVLALAVAPLAFVAAIRPVFSAATFTGVLVLLVPGLVHVSPIESALYRVLEVTVGGLTALCVSLLLPVRARSMAIEAAARMLDQAASLVPGLFAGFRQPLDATAIARLQDGIGQAFARLDAVMAEARHEQIGILAAKPDLGPVRRTLLRLRHDLVMIGRAAALPLPDIFQARLGAPLARIAESVAAYLRANAEALASRNDHPALDAAEVAFNDYTRGFAAMRAERLSQGLAVDAVERVFTLGFALEQLRLDLRDLERCVQEIRGTSSRSA